MRRRIPSALLLTALAATSVAAAPPSLSRLSDEDRANAEARLDDATAGAVAPTGLSSSRAKELLQARFEERSPKAEILGLLDVLDELPGLTPLAQDPHAGAGTAETIVAGPLEFAVPVGDLDGDGGDDVVALAVENHEDETATYRLEALRGRDGVALWEVPLSEDDGWWFPYLTPDVDGDGAPDLAFFDVVFEDDCVCDGADGMDWRESVTQTWSFHSGRTGVEISQRSLTGERWGRDEESYTSDGLTDRTVVRYESHARGVFAPLWFVGDQDGDGLEDVVSVVLDDDYEFHYEERDTLGLLIENEDRYVQASSASLTVESLDGRTIRDLGALVPDGRPWVQPLTWDGGPADLLIEVEGNVRDERSCTYDPVRNWSCETSLERDPAMTLAVVEAGSASVRWMRDTDTDADLAEISGYPVAPGADLTGDGRADLVMADWSAGTVIDGATGAVWEPLRGVDVQAFLGDDGRPILLSVGRSTFEVTCVVENRVAELDDVLLELRDGRTGDVLARSAYNDDESCESGPRALNAFPVGDHDGDGIRDLAISVYDHETDTVRTDVAPAFGDGLLADDLDGALYGIGDVNGDGTEDLNVFDWMGSRDEIVVAMPGASLLWTAEDGGILQQAGDVDGDGRADVIVHEREYVEHADGATVTHWLDVARGVDGTPFWTSQPVTHEWRWAEAVED